MTTKEKIEVMQAFEDGETVLTGGRNGTTPEPCDDPQWDWMHCDYYIKPKPKAPRRSWVRYHRDQVKPCGFAMSVSDEFIFQQDTEQVQLIELTPEVIAALADAGIGYEGGEQ